jgi:hypothetical protein
MVVIPDDPYTVKISASIKHIRARTRGKMPWGYKAGTDANLSMNLLRGRVAGGPYR